MGIIAKILSPFFRPARKTRSRRFGAITAANMEKSKSGGWRGIQSDRDEDRVNKEYLFALSSVIQRSQDLDVNNPDLGGFHRTRVAQILGSGVKFKHAPIPEEIGVSDDEATAIAEQVNRLRQLHSNDGGLDSTGQNRSEGKLQEVAYLTAMINGCCLIHRVWRPENTLLPLSIELIPGVRISTPNQRMGDPLLSFGIEYSDEHRTRVAAYHVRRVSKTIGDSFVPEYDWDRLPAEDCSLLSLTEQAGLDRALPIGTRVTRMMRNRGEFIESTVEGARAQAQHYGVTECAPGQDPYAAAEDDSNYIGPGGQGFTDLGGGVKMLYNMAGEKTTWSSAKLPDPDFSGFMDKTDERMARGLVCSLSRFTRKVNSSWAGGRLEDQQDDPIIEQLRTSFLCAWHRVNAWFIEATWISDAVELPNYSAKTAVYWNQFAAGFYGRVHINPSDSMKARETAFMLRSCTPQQASAEDGTDLRENYRQWAQAIKIQREEEKKAGLPEGTIQILFSGRAISTSAGEEIAPPDPEVEEDPAAPNAKLTNGHKSSLRIAGVN